MFSMNIQRGFAALLRKRNENYLNLLQRAPRISINRNRFIVIGNQVCWLVGKETEGTDLSREDPSGF